MPKKLKGKKITNIEALLERIHSGKPIGARNYVYTAELAGSYSLQYWADALKEGVVFEYRDLEHFDSSLTVEELIAVLKEFAPELIIQITGAYGSDTDSILGFKIEANKLVIMTDICSG